MVVKTPNGMWVVKSKDGKQRLSQPYPTEHKARKRLMQIEYFKHKGSTGSKDS